jgi:hypothetical protein
MIAHRRYQIVSKNKEKNRMKKLMTMMLGLALLTGTVAISFAQDTKTDSTMKKGKKGKKGSKKGDDTSKRGVR